MANPLWITYAWADNNDGDFDFLVQELGRAGVLARYDKIALIPGRKLWTQIADRISSDPLSGWAYLVTPSSLASLACQEELSYALQRALESHGEEFPLIGLLHNVSILDVPLSLQVRLCINLANPDWIEEVCATVAGTPPRRVVPDQNQVLVKIHNGYLGQPGRLAIEVRPRFGELRYWRLAFPKGGVQPIQWGTDPANGGGIGALKQEVIEGEYPDIAGEPMKFIGAGNPISASTSAYAVFDTRFPDRFFFGVAKEPFGTEASGAIFNVGAV
jgi:hypothetical protein